MILLNNIRVSINLLDRTTPITLSDNILQEKTAADTEAEGEVEEMGTVGTGLWVIRPRIVATDPADSQPMDRKLLTGEREKGAGVITKTTTLKRNGQEDTIKNREEEKRTINQPHKSTALTRM